MGNGGEGSYKVRWGKGHKLCLSLRIWTSKNKVQTLFLEIQMPWSKRGQKNVIGFGSMDIGHWRLNQNHFSWVIGGGSDLQRVRVSEECGLLDISWNLYWRMRNQRKFDWLVLFFFNFIFWQNFRLQRISNSTNNSYI